MKISLILAALILPLSALGQATAGSAGAERFFVLERTPHTRIWGLSTATNQPGAPQLLHNFTELASGLCYTNPDTGALEDSSPEFTITSDGYAVSDRCQHKLIVSPRIDDPDGVVDCLMPDGQRLRGTILGLVLSSHRTGQSLQIGAIKTSAASEQTAPNEITFPDCFDGMLRASVRIRNEIGQWHQDIVLQERFSKEQLTKLAALGFDNPTEVRLSGCDRSFTVGKQTFTAVRSNLHTRSAVGFPVVLPWNGALRAKREGRNGTAEQRCARTCPCPSPRILHPLTR